MAIYREMYDGPPLHYGTRVTTKRVIAIHNTSNDATRQQEASYAKRRADSVSSHYYADSTGVTQSLDTDLRAYHAGSTLGNDIGISYEITGVNGWSRQQWLERVDWPALAAAVARDCRRHGIEVRLLTVAQMRDGRSTGVVTHDLMRQAWGGTTHTDPGPNFPMDHLLAMVRAVMTGTTLTPEEDTMPTYWFAGKQPERWFGNAEFRYKVSTQEETDRRWIADHEAGRFIVAKDRENIGGMGPEIRPAALTSPITDEQLERVLRKVLGMAPAS